MKNNYLFVKKTPALPRLPGNFMVHAKYLIILIMFMFLNKSLPAQSDSTESIHRTTPTAVNGTAIIRDSSVNYSPSTYPDGTNGFLRYLMRNLNLDLTKNLKADASITVTFTVEENGKLSNLHASEGPGYIQKEAIRLVKHSGKWIPAYKDGHPIISQQQQQISFKVN